jgi:hypothetical protein
LLAAIAGPRLAFTRPLAAGLMAFGVIGLTFSGGPAAALFGDQLAPVTVGDKSNGFPESAADPTAAASQREGFITDSGESRTTEPFDRTPIQAPGDSGPPAHGAGDPGSGSGNTAQTGGDLSVALAVEPAPDRTVAVLSGSIVLVGGGLLLLRWLASRAIGA